MHGFECGIAALGEPMALPRLSGTSVTHMCMQPKKSDLKPDPLVTLSTHALEA
jgi:hypothetical protein